MTVPIAKFVAALGDALARGDGYIMGAYGQNPRTGYLDLNKTDVKAAWKPTGYYYAQYTDTQQHAQALKWRERCTRVWDCNGLAEGIYQLQTGENINSKARYNYAQWCDPKGEGMIPAARRVPGAAVFWGPSAAKIEHVAYLFEPVDASNPAGDWWLIEARGVMLGVVKTKLSQRKPGYWGWMTKYFDYAATDTGSTPPAPDSQRPTLRRGDMGKAVRDVQQRLADMGYDLGKWGVDGDFGTATEAAVRKFQTARGLTADGIVGAATWAALEDTQRPRTYTITIHGVQQVEMEKMLERWPECEVTEE